MYTLVDFEKIKASIDSPTFFHETGFMFIGGRESMRSSMFWSKKAL
jgi:hypothetical protein